MPVRSSGRHASRLLAVLLVLVSVATTAWAQDADEVREELDRTESQLEDARGALEEAEEQVGSAQEELHSADLRLHDMTSRLRALEAELAAAQAELDAARGEADRAREELERLTLRLARKKEELTVHEQRFKHRVAAAYKYGSVSYASVLMGSNDVAEFLSTSKYVQAVMDDDRAVVEQVTATAAQLAEIRARADAVREGLAHEEELAESLATDVAAAAARQRELTAQVEAERAERAQLLRRYESRQEQHEDLVASLEAESESLTAELRKLESVGQAPGAGGLFWPTNGYKTSDYGWRTHPIFGSRRMHSGVDISGSTGQPIIAAATGTVVHAGWRGGYGLTVVIDHGGGMATLYAHQSALSVASGQRVEGGQKIGEVGSTGYSTGPHLHFEVRINGEPRDPMQWY